MNFNKLHNIEKPQWYLDHAFSTATKQAGVARAAAKGSRLDKSITVELVRVTGVQKALQKHLKLILTSFPSIDALPEFYKELIKTTIDYVMLKQALGSVNWCLEKVDFFSNTYVRQIKRTKELQRAGELRKEYYGRISSLIKQISKHLTFLESSRKVMVNYPAIKENIFTVAIAGFPNVGKSTLLKKVSGADVEIKNYAFTTKKLNTGYISDGKVRMLQLIDTPGTLNRFDKMNMIEQQAYLALKYCADMIVYVYDFTEPYPIADQKKLLLELKRFRKDIITYMSKADVIKDPDQYTSKVDFSDAAKLKVELLKRAKEY